jgi:hypothetical protein
MRPLRTAVAFASLREPRSNARTLKRSATSLLALLGAMALAASASAATTAYSGAFHGSGKLRFRALKTRHKDEIRGNSKRGFSFTDFPLRTCAHGPNSEDGFIGFPIKVRHGKFKAIGLKGNRQHPSAKLVLRGRFTHRRRQAQGTMRVSGSAVKVNDRANGAHDRCDSGVVHWTARARSARTR